MKEKRPEIPPAFSDDDGFGLEHVLYALGEEAKAADTELRDPHGIPYFRELLHRVDEQWQAHRHTVEADMPGLFDRLEGAEAYAQAWELIQTIGNNRAKLAAYLPDLERSLRKISALYLESREDFARRGEAQLRQLQRMRNQARKKSTKYGESEKNQWRAYIREKTENSSRPLNESDRARAVLKQFDLPANVERTVKRALKDIK